MARARYQAAGQERGAGLSVMGLARRLRGERTGQALVEFAIVAPIIVMVLLFAIWFLELVTIKLKLQEMARYAAWEATGYALHDYDKGKSANSQLFTQMQSSVKSDSLLRYADLDSSTTVPTSTSILAASWIPPLVFSTNQKEEVVYGGSIVNTIVNFLGTIIALGYAANYKNINPLAVILVALGKDYAGTGANVAWGDSSWGFNKSGYVEAVASTIVTNNFFNYGVGEMVLPNMGVVLIEKHGVLADSWRLHKGADVYGDNIKPGVSKSQPFWKQVDRMYFMKKAGRSTAETFVKAFRLVMGIALALSMSTATPPNLADTDWVQTSVVSKNYKSQDSGQAPITQDRGSTKKYDTAPVCASCSGGDSLKPYGQTLKARGSNFMGCDKEMQLGCPSSTLQQDNPFGDYIIRD